MAWTSGEEDEEDEEEEDEEDEDEDEDEEDSEEEADRLVEEEELEISLDMLLDATLVSDKLLFVIEDDSSFVPQLKSGNANNAKTGRIL